MYKIVSIFFVFFLCPFLSMGQEATIHFTIQNSTSKSIMIVLIDDYTNPEVLFGEYYVDVPLTNGETTWTLNLSKPTSIKAYYETDDSQKYLEYYFYLSPNDDLRFLADENNLQTSVMVSGEGSKNNQPLIQSLHDSFADTLYITYRKDTLPNLVFEAIEDKSSRNLRVLEDYITKYHPSEAFIRNESLYVKHFPLSQYFYFKGRKQLYITEAYFRNAGDWQHIEDSLIIANPINNDDLLNVSDYANFLSNYLERTKERLWLDSLFKEQYFENESDKELVDDDPENLLREKIISKQFTGKTAEFLYALVFQDAGYGKDDNLPEIFKRFRQKYPDSQYHPYIEPGIAEIEKRRERKLTNSMILITDMDSLQTFDDVLNLVEGKTVLLDMWGTWCLPCRTELSKNSEAIKMYFEGRELDYLYIANYDLHHESKWRELIPYYNLTGMHILANESLTKDIMAKIKSSSYPSYVIIKKDGTFELCEQLIEMDALYVKLGKILNE